MLLWQRVPEGKFEISGIISIVSQFLLDLCLFCLLRPILYFQGYFHWTSCPSKASLSIRSVLEKTVQPLWKLDRFRSGFRSMTVSMTSMIQSDNATNNSLARLEEHIAKNGWREIVRISSREEKKETIGTKGAIASVIIDDNPIQTLKSPLTDATVADDVQTHVELGALKYHRALSLNFKTTRQSSNSNFNRLAF